MGSTILEVSSLNFCLDYQAAIIGKTVSIPAGTANEMLRSHAIGE
jgi:hypothetical protein